MACRTIQEKFRKALAQRGGDDQLGGRNAGADSSQPGAEGLPYHLGECGGEILKQTLSDDTGLDEEMIGVEFSFDEIAIVKRFAMQMLVTVPSAQWLHF